MAAPLKSPLKILCLSNGHGEDGIGRQIAAALRHHPRSPEVAALPIVGTGTSYQQADIPLIGAAKALPSGGFIYMDGRQLARDLQGGLLQLTWSQLRTVRTWAKSGGVVLAVGDVVPLLFAWLSGAPYAFVGTAKSEYYLRDELGPLPRSHWWHNVEGWSGSVYLPWERWLMGRRRCRGIFPRDTLTTQVLQTFRLPAFDLGNPMMDGLTAAPTNQPPLDQAQPPLTIVLLPGSRPPEAYANWQLILQAVQHLRRAYAPRPLRFLAGIAPALDLAKFAAAIPPPWITRQPQRYQAEQAEIILSQSDYVQFLQQADLAIAMAGTATEQVVGLGKPAITIPGQGPQFTPEFAEAQTRLLGPSVRLVESPDQVVTVCDRLLSDPDQLQLVAENGQRRMGASGAAARIADHLLTHCFTEA